MIEAVVAVDGMHREGCVDGENRAANASTVWFPPRSI